MELNEIVNIFKIFNIRDGKLLKIILYNFPQKIKTSIRKKLATKNLDLHGVF
jgi:hypothetical protein